MDDKVLLEIKDLFVKYVTDDGDANVVNGLNLTINKGECIGLVGETGAGKTTTALSIMRLLPQPAGVVSQGSIYYKNENLISMDDKKIRSIRGKGISMIFQDPMTALDPTLTIGKQLMEAIMAHTKISKREAEKNCIDLLETVGIQRNRFKDYPHQLSGGMKQRVVIAMALLCNPEILIADEPTTALDVTIQAQVLEIINKLIKKNNMSMLLITHDLGVVAQMCSRVAVMYAGEVVETGTIEEVYTNPKHPYTIGLFNSIPDLDSDNEYLIPIVGFPPNPKRLSNGCKFWPRCSYATEICKNKNPNYYGKTHLCKCHSNIRGDLR